MVKWPWRSERDDDAYSIFTTAYDRDVSGKELTDALSAEDKRVWHEQIEAFARATELCRTQTGLAMLPQVDAALAGRPSLAEDTVVSVVVDHSGSLRGQRAMIACLLVQMIADFLDRLGVRHEILGFTTTSWRGGRSRERWIARGRPKRPGRLADLLHIRYREATQATPGAPWTIHHLLRSDLLKENLDGEALFSAAERLKNLDAEHNLVLAISDGAPVDDSTLMANGPDILMRHLKAVVADLSATPGFRMAGIGIDHDVSRLYPDALRVDRLDEIPRRLPEFLGKLFV